MRLTPAAGVLACQDGVISRAQLLEVGVTSAQVETCLRRGDLVAVHPGVYVNHTGKLTWQQRAWAAVLYAGRSALHLESALHRRGRAGPPKGPVEVAIDWSRRVDPQPGIRVHRVRGLEGKVAWNTSPPRVRLEEAAVELAHRATDDLAAIAPLTDLVGARRTVASRLAATIAARPRLRRRALLVSLLEDLAHGTHSVLEHGFLERVIRQHGLPEPSSQQAPRAGATGSEYRDAEYAAFDLPVELDGRTHDTAEARDADADRDLDDLAQGGTTLRLRYPQVFGTPCRTAARLQCLFVLRGWVGTAHPCDDPRCDLAGPAA